MGRPKASKADCEQLSNELNNAMHTGGFKTIKALSRDLGMSRTTVAERIRCPHRRCTKNLMARFKEAMSGSACMNTSELLIKANKIKLRELASGAWGHTEEKDFEQFVIRSSEVELKVSKFAARELYKILETLDKQNRLY